MVAILVTPNGETTANVDYRIDILSGLLLICYSLAHSR